MSKSREPTSLGGDPMVEAALSTRRRVATTAERANLLTVTQFMISLRYHDEDPALCERLCEIMGGRQAMIESPLYQEIVAEAERKGETKARQQDIVEILMSRFGRAAKAVEFKLQAVEFERLRDLLKIAVECPSLAAFRKRLSP
jgi:hypothetical protein